MMATAAADTPTCFSMAPRSCTGSLRSSQGDTAAPLRSRRPSCATPADSRMSCCRVVPRCMATGNTSYLHSILPLPAGAPPSVFYWDDKLPGSQLLLDRLRLLLSPGYPCEEMLSRFQAQTDNAMCSYLPVFKTFNFTKGGVTQLNHGGPRPLQYVVNAAFLASLYATHIWTPQAQQGGVVDLISTPHKPSETLRGHRQEPTATYIVGFGNKYPEHVHRRGASIPYDGVKYGCKGGTEWKQSKKANPNVILGVMAAGPDRHDSFKDVRGNCNNTSFAYAGLVAALISVADIVTAGRSC